MFGDSLKAEVAALRKEVEELRNAMAYHKANAWITVYGSTKGDIPHSTDRKQISIKEAVEILAQGMNYQFRYNKGQPESVSVVPCEIREVVGYDLSPPKAKKRRAGQQEG